jgi:hypothetical protein
VEKSSKEFLAPVHSFCVFVVQQKKTTTQNQKTTKLMNRIAKGLGPTSSAPSGSFANATINARLPNPFVRKETKTKQVRPWLHQIKTYGNITFRNRQGMDSLDSNLVEGACVGMVDVPKA